MTARRYTMSELGGLDRAEFTRVVGPVFEHSPWIAERTWDKRPFGSLKALHCALTETVAAAPQAKQLALVRAHPDLVGKAAQVGTLTAPSVREQASAGLDRLTPEERAWFQQHNHEYREKFGFPFVICARLNKKDAIRAGFVERLPHSSAQELETALAEIGKIAWLRLQDLAAESTE